MNRAFARPVAGVALAILLLLLAVPNVGAGQLPSTRTAPRAQADWKTAAWAWLSEITGWHYGTRVPLASPQATDNTGMTRLFGATGSCIDPFGHLCPCADSVIKPPTLLGGPTGIATSPTT
jgi:hypothetical protein